ncbi:MAG: M48 family metallopeptidase [Promethearchaeota archaeon]
MIKSWRYSKSLINNYLKDLGIAYIVEHRNVKYPRLEFKSENKLLVVLPFDVENEFELLIKKRKWIEKKHRSIEEAINRVKEYKKFIDSKDRLLLFGKYYQLYTAEYNKISIINNIIEIPEISDNSIYIYLRKWLKKHLKEKLTDILEKYSKELNIKFNRITIRIQKNKWGSYSFKGGNLNFNLKLIALPENLIKYVAFHELIHINNKYHNEKFWDLISSKFPDYKEYEQLLTGFWFLLNENQLWNKILNL